MNEHHTFQAKGGTAHRMEDTSKTMWDIGEMVFGPGVPVSRGYEPKAVICFETPFGTVCVEINATTLNAHQAEAKKMKFQDVMQEVLARPRLKGVCFWVCTPIGVCFEVCL